MTKQTAIRKIAEGLFEYADAMYEEEQATAPVSARPSAVSEPVEDLFPPFEETAAAPQGSLSQCPSHKARYQSGKYGFYCPARSDDPAWANKKGYCTITPDNAAEWLRITAA
jgi:hypothetical protein